MIIKAILDLKQEVDALKSIVHSGASAAVSAPAPAMVVPRQLDEPEEQMSSYEESAGAEEDMNMRHMGEELIERALQRHGGKVKEAAKELGISERTIYRKLAAKKKTS